MSLVKSRPRGVLARSSAIREGAIRCVSSGGAGGSAGRTTGGLGGGGARSARTKAVDSTRVPSRRTIVRGLRFSSSQPRAPQTSHGKPASSAALPEQKLHTCRLSPTMRTQPVASQNGHLRPLLIRPEPEQKLHTYSFTTDPCGMGARDTLGITLGRLTIRLRITSLPISLTSIAMPTGKSTMP